MIGIKINKDENYAYVTLNYRHIIDNNWLDDLKYQCEPTEFHEKRVTVNMICDIGVSREFNRHRTFSITEQSTRYCNFSKDKFNNEVTFIIPNWTSTEENNVYQNDLITEYDRCNIVGDKANTSEECEYLRSLLESEKRYFTLLNSGWKPQQARAVLPLSTATEVYYTAFVSDWKHFFTLRTASGAHPQARELAIPLEEEFKRLELI